MNRDQNILNELRTIEENVCRQAIEARDARFYAVFVYSVRSTGVYCRLS